MQPMDLSKATLRIDNAAEVVSAKAGSGSEQNYAHKIGRLAGAGTLGCGIWNAGGLTYISGPTVINGTLKLNNPVIDITELSKKIISENTELKILTINGSVSIEGSPSIIPSVPKEGWEWDMSTLATDGVLRIKASANIDTVETDPTTNPGIFTLNGTKVNSTTSLPKGTIIIVNGKKIINR